MFRVVIEVLGRHALDCPVCIAGDKHFSLTSIETPRLRLTMHLAYNNNNNLQALQLTVLARYLLGVPNPTPVSQHVLT